MRSPRWAGRRRLRRTERTIQREDTASCGPIASRVTPGSTRPVSILTSRSQISQSQTHRWLRCRRCSLRRCRSGPGTWSSCAARSSPAERPRGSSSSAGRRRSARRASAPVPGWSGGTCRGRTGHRGRRPRPRPRRAPDRSERGIQATLLARGQAVPPGSQDMADPVESLARLAAVAESLLLDPAANATGGLRLGPLSGLIAFEGVGGV